MTYQDTPIGESLFNEKVICQATTPLVLGETYYTAVKGQLFILHAFTIENVTIQFVNPYKPNSTMYMSHVCSVLCGRTTEKGPGPPALPAGRASTLQRRRQMHD
jgi:hypothetical protein